MASYFPSLILSPGWLIVMLILVSAHGDIQSTNSSPTKPFTRNYFVMGPNKGVSLHKNQESASPVDRQINFLDAQPLPSGEEPGAYSWGYQWRDEFGTQMFREETANGLGTVWGRYSFRTTNGILRIVEYMADGRGVHTRIRSNEPGLISSNPANAEIIKFEDANIPKLENSYL